MYPSTEEDFRELSEQGLTLAYYQSLVKEIPDTPFDVEWKFRGERKVEGRPSVYIYFSIVPIGMEFEISLWYEENVNNGLDF